MGLYWMKLTVHQVIIAWKLASLMEAANGLRSTAMVPFAICLRTVHSFKQIVLPVYQAKSYVQRIWVGYFTKILR